MKRSLLPIYGTLLIALLCLCGKPVYADTGLAQRCDGITVATQAAACTGSRTWLHPGPSDYILTLSTVPADSTTISWSAPDLQFREWIEIPGTMGVQICTKDLSADQTPIPIGGADNCAPGGDPVLKKFVPASTVSLGSPVVLIPTVNVAALAWTAPTQNTDGSALTDLAGYNIYQGTTVGNLVKVGSIALPAASYTTPSLPPGTYYFTVTAVNAKGTESAQSPVVSTVLAPPPPKVPGAPTGVKITVIVTAGP